MNRVEPTVEEANEHREIEESNEPPLLISGNASSNYNKRDIEQNPRFNASQDRDEWEPYKNAGAELPLTALLNPPTFLYRLRWNILKIFHTRVFTFWDNVITLGEVILIPGIVIAFSLIASLSCCESETTGSVAGFAIFFTFLFSSKNSVVTLLSGISQERLLFLHKLFALISIATTLLHGLTSEQDEEESLNGWIFSGFIFGAVVVAFYYFRRWFYEIFYLLHIGMALGVVVLAFIHPSTMAYVGGFFWFADVACKFLIVVINRKNAQKCLLKRLPCDVVQVKFRKGNFKYLSGQYVSICVPKISIFQWHLFSISSAPHEDFVTLHIRVLGDWTKKLHDVLSVSEESEWTVFINGAYGVPGIHNEPDYRLFIMVSGGIGITPLQSIANDLLSNCKDGRTIYRIIFVWSVRDAHMITAVRGYDEDHFHKQLPKSLPTSFQPDLLEEQRNEKNNCRFDCYYHITDVRSHKDFTKGNINPSGQKKLKVGRPHMSQYYEEMFEYANKEGETKVAVLCCGPSQMVAEALMHASTWSKDGITFDFYPEIFEM